MAAAEDVSSGGLSAPTFAGVAGFGGMGDGGFGGGGGSGFAGGGGGGGYSGGGGASFSGGGGGGSYLNPAMRDTIETPDFNGSPGQPPNNGYVIVGLTEFNYTGTVVEYTIPTTGFYYVAAVGAQSGSVFGNGGYGAGVGGTVFLDMGTELDIVAGGAGMMNFLLAAAAAGKLRLGPDRGPPATGPRAVDLGDDAHRLRRACGLQPASGFRSRGDTRLILLCHDDPGLDRRDGKAWRHGQRMRVRASAIVSCLRIVAIEFSNLAVSTRTSKGMSSGRVESQYFAGSFSPSGHSMRSHSSG